MKYFLIVLTAILFSQKFYAQSSEDSVKAAVNKMFKAMKEVDAISLKSCFADSIAFQTVVQSKDGNLVVTNENPADFIDFVAKGKPGSFDERISFDIVKVDGPLAIAWAPYKFYYDGQFSHCGMDSFQLVRFNGVWKIQYIIDTRRKQPCD